IDGIPIPVRSILPRPGVPSLEDAFKVAPDFVLLRTTRRTVNDFLTQFDLEPVRKIFETDLSLPGQKVIILGGMKSGDGTGSLVVDDACVRLEFEFDSKAGYVVDRCHEYPAGGLRLVRAWYRNPKSQAMTEADMREMDIRIGPR